MKLATTTLLLALSTIPISLRGSDAEEPGETNVAKVIAVKKGNQVTSVEIYKPQNELEEKLIEVLDKHNIINKDDDSKNIKATIDLFTKIEIEDKKDTPNIVDNLLNTYYISNLPATEEKANAINDIYKSFKPYTKDAEDMKIALNALAWEKYIKNIDELSHKELATSIVNKLKPYKFITTPATLLAKKGIDPKYANDYLEKAKARIPYHLDIAQLIIHEVPVDFYLKHKSHDVSMSINEHNEQVIRELLRDGGEKDVDKTLAEMKKMYPNLGLAFPNQFVKSYRAIKNMERDSNFKLDNIVLFLLPNHIPGYDPGTRMDSAFMQCGFPISDLEDLGFNVLLSSYNKDTDINEIADEISGNNNSTPGTEWPLTAMAIGGHGFGHKLHISDIPFAVDQSNESISAATFDINESEIFASLEDSFKKEGPVIVILCSCSTASPKAKPYSLYTAARRKLPKRFTVQAPAIDTFIHGAHLKNNLPHLILDGSRSGSGLK